MDTKAGTYNFDHWAYLKIDEDQPSTDLLTDEELLRNVQNETEPENMSEPEDNDVPEPEPPTSYQEALKSYDCLKKFLQEQQVYNTNVLKFLKTNV